MPVTPSNETNESNSTSGSSFTRRKLLTALSVGGLSLGVGGLLQTTVLAKRQDYSVNHAVYGDGPKWLDSCVQLSTIAELRAWAGTSLPSAVLIADDQCEGIYVHDEQDSVSADNTGTVIVTASNKRYKRILTPDKIINARWFGAKGDGVSDDTSSLQAAFDCARLTGAKLHIPAGRYVVTDTLRYVNVVSAALPPLYCFGDGPGRTELVSRVAGGPCLRLDNSSFAAPGNYFFAKYGSLCDFSITSDQSTGGDGIHISACWYYKFENVMLNSLAGYGIIIGGSSSINPDLTASAHLLLVRCDIQRNKGGVWNKINNNAPFLTFKNCNVSKNSIFGIKGNSSYIAIEETAVSYNGIGNVNAEGGILIEDQTASNYSLGYRSKGVSIRKVELDSNYPVQISLKSTIGAEVKSCSIALQTQFNSAFFATNGLPAHLIVVGGNGNYDKTFGTVIESNQISVNNANTSPTNNHSCVYLGESAIGTTYSNNTYNFQGVSIGTNLFVMEEADKALSAQYASYDKPQYYVAYDFPNLNLGESANAAYHAFKVKYKKSHASPASTVFGYRLNKDQVAVLNLPVSLSVAGGYYGAAFITCNGKMSASAIVGYRAATGPECYMMTSNAAADITTTTGVLTGTTGADLKINVSVDAAGHLYIENRYGTLNIHVTLLNNAGLYLPT